MILKDARFTGVQSRNESEDRLYAFEFPLIFDLRVGHMKASTESKFQREERISSMQCRKTGALTSKHTGVSLSRATGMSYMMDI